MEQASGDGKERFEQNEAISSAKRSEAFENNVENLWKTLSGLVKSWSLRNQNALWKR